MLGKILLQCYMYWLKHTLLPNCSSNRTNGNCSCNHLNLCKKAVLIQSFFHKKGAFLLKRYCFSFSLPTLSASRGKLGEKRVRACIAETRIKSTYIKCIEEICVFLKPLLSLLRSKAQSICLLWKYVKRIW